MTARTVANDRLIDGAKIDNLPSDTTTDLASKLAIASNLSDVADQQIALNTITAVSGATNEYVLTKDTGTGNAVWKVGGSGSGSVTSVAAGDGMDFTTITTTGTVTMGTPTTLTGSTTNAVTATSHTHVVTLDTDDVTEGATNKYFNGKTQDNLPSGTTYKQYNPASILITGGVISGVSVNAVTLSTGAGSTNFLAGDGTYKAAGTGTVTQVGAGNGMDYTTITTSGNVTMGTPSTLTGSTTNAVTATSHTHAVTTTLQDAFDNGQSIIISDGDSQTLQITNNDATNLPQTLRIDTNVDASGILLSGSGNATHFRAVVSNTTANVFSITCNTSTTGGLGYFYSDSPVNAIRNLVEIHNDNTLANGAKCLTLQQDSNAIALNVDYNGTFNAVRFDASTASSLPANPAVWFSADSLLGTPILRLSSDSASANTRTLLEVINDNTAATGVTVLTLQQDAVTSTNFKKIKNEGGVISWISDGTTPNGNLTGTAGDTCKNGPGGQMFFCAGGTTWTGM